MVELKFTDAREQPHVLRTTLAALTASSTDSSDSPSSASLPPLRNPPLLESVDDLTNLSYLNEPAVLHSLKTRYAARSAPAIAYLNASTLTPSPEDPSTPSPASS